MQIEPWCRFAGANVTDNAANHLARKRGGPTRTPPLADGGQNHLEIFGMPYPSARWDFAR